MPRQIPIVGGYYKDPDRHWSRQDCLNWIPVKAERPGALTEWILRDAPGLKPYVQIADDTGGIRGARNVEGKLFVVWRSTLYQISNAGVAIPCGTVPGIGRVSMAHNAKGLGNELLTVNGSAGYVYDTITQDFAKVTDPGYPGAFIADFVDQYLAQVEPQGRYWFHSDLANAHAYNTLDQYQAEGDPDRIVSLLVSHREVLVFGADTIEPYVNTGGSTGTFERASNTVIEVGCAARFSTRRMDSSAFWLDDQRLVRRLDGYTPVILSTEAIAGAFAECTAAEIAQAYAFTWEGGGHKVYYITVPGRFTFGYDAKTGEWHRRASYGLPHWAVSEIVFWNGKWYACDSRYPRLFELDASYKLDGCDPLVRERSAQVVWADQNEVTLDELELMFGTPSVESVCVAFPEQPPSPTITGSAPDGVKFLPYTAYSYIGSGGTGALSYSLIGTLPPGLSFDASTATITGMPTATGSYPFRVRVTDANGMWDEVSDGIEVASDVIALTTDLHLFTGDYDNLQEGIPNGTTGATGGSMSISPNTRFIAYGRGSGDYLYLRERREDGTGYNALPTPADLPTGEVHATDFSPDGQFLAVSFRPGTPDARLFVYRIDDNVFTLLDQADGYAGNAVKWSHSGERLAWCSSIDGGDPSNGWRVFDWNGTTLSAPVYAATTESAQPPVRIDWSHNDQFLADGNNNHLIVWDATNSPITLVDKADGSGPAAGRGVFFSPDDTFIYTVATAAVSGNRVSIYGFTGSSLSAPVFPSDQPAGAASDSSMSSDGECLVLGVTATGACLFVYEVNNGSLSVPPSQPVTSEGSTGNVAWTRASNE